MLLFARAVCAQAALDGFDPNANGPINAIAVQPDGKILVGGAFTALAPNGGPAVTRNRIARLNIDGTLDAFFDPNADNTINAIAVQPDGGIVVGGSFTQLGGQTKHRLARVNSNGTVDTSFDPDIDSTVDTLVLQPDGKIIIGGAFGSVGGHARNRIARLNPNGTTDISFDPNAGTITTEVTALAMQSDGKVLVGGVFGSMGGQPRQNLARLEPSGVADAAFDPGASSLVMSFAVQADGDIVVGGLFGTIGGENRSDIARLHPNGTVDTSFAPNAVGDVNTVAQQVDGKILLGGSFVTVGGQSRHRIARLNTDGSVDPLFDPSAAGNIRCIATQSDGKILVGGAIGSFSPNGGPTIVRNNVARLEIDGRVDRALDAMLGAQYIWATAVQPDGKILLAGAFSSVGGVSRGNIARLNTDGSLDTDFNAQANDWVYSLAVQPDGKILAGGFFTSINGQPRNHIARLDGVTGAPDSFDPNANMTVYSLAVQPDNKILVGGAFTSIGGQSRSRFARLDGATGMADAFDPNAGGFIYPFVFAITVQPDGKIIVGGDFRFIGGQTRNHIARLDPTTGLADEFDPNATGTVGAIALQADGKVLVGGDFHGSNSIGGQPRNYIARLDAVTGVADSFNPGAASTVNALAVEPDGKVYAGGLFSNIGGQPRNYLARLDGTTGLADAFNPNPNFGITALTTQADGRIIAGGAFTANNSNPFVRYNNDAPGLQDLAVTRNTITWTRTGAGPQFTHVTFESSIDNANFTALGNGTASGSNWVLAGLNLPPGANFYIRARGYHRGGFRSGSESVSESVHRVFLTGPTVTKTDDSNGTCAVNNCSLREAIAAAAPGDVITFSPLFNTPQTITLTFGELLINKSVTVQGPGANLLTVSGNDSSRLFSIGSGFAVVLNGMTIMRGSGAGASFNNSGGAILNFGILTIDRCMLSNNSAGAGGAIFNEGTLTVLASTISANVASGNLSGTAGGIDNTGGNLTMTSSTVSGNSVVNGDFNGGAITSNTVVTITSSTITNNTAPGANSGSAIYRSHGSVTLRNTIVAGNVNNGALPDIVAAGSIISNGYNLIGNRGTLTFSGPGDQSGTAGAPLDPRLAPLASNGGPTRTHALLAGSTAIDAGNSSGSATDQRGRARPIDLVGVPNVSDASDIGAFERQGWTRFDYDGDERADISVFRPSTATWYLQQSSAGFTGVSWGAATDKITPADYDGDGRTDIAVYRPSEGNWYILRSSNGTLLATHFGATEDFPQPADFDSDGKADVAVFRPSTGTWWILRSTAGLVSAQFGATGDKPVAADYDGLGRAELAVFRPSNGTWYYSGDLTDPAHHFAAVQFGFSTDLLTPADFDGDGKTDVAVYRPSNGTWYALVSSSGSFAAVQFGTSEDQPVAADYDGDGRADVAVFRPSNGAWYRLNSSNGSFFAAQFGINTDRPTPAAFRY